MLCIQKSHERLNMGGNEKYSQQRMQKEGVKCDLCTGLLGWNPLRKHGELGGKRESLTTAGH